MYVYMYTSIQKNLRETSDRRKGGKPRFVLVALPTGARHRRKPTFRLKLPVRGQLDVPRCPKPPVQGHLDVQRCPKPPVHGQLDVQKLPETVSPELTSAQSAEPPFLLAGVVLQRVGTHGNNTEKRGVPTKNRSNNASRTNGAYELSRLSLLDTTWRRFWSPRRTPGRSWALPARKLDQSLPPGPSPIDPLRST